MKFSLSSEQVQFSAALRDVLTDSDVPSAARAWARGDHASGLAVWRKLEALGVTTLLDDGSPVDLVVAMEAIGYHALPGPAAESLGVLRSFGTVAMPYAVDADIAPAFVVEDNTVFAGIVGDQMSSVDPCRRLFTVTAGDRVGTLHDGALDHGVLACAAQLLGAGCALLDQSVAYAKQRSQFGRPIGAFQAVKHQLADVHVGLELARPLVHGAALSAIPVSAAKIAAADAAYRAARCALQVHGAIGYTAEYDLSLWLTKVRALQSTWGTSAVHRARLLGYRGDLRPTPHQASW